MKCVYTNHSMDDTTIVAGETSEMTQHTTQMSARTPSMTEAGSDIVEIRYATLDDYDAVMAINETIFQGADYLPEMYTEFITDPTTRCYVLEINNAVAGFCALSVVNAGKTVLLKGAQIKQKYKGLGYFWKRFTPVCQSDIRYYFPEVQNSIQMGTFDLGNIKNFEKSVNSNPLVHLVSRVTVEATANDIDIANVQYPSGNVVVEVVPKSELQMRMEDNMKILQPFVEIKFQPYEVTNANIKYIVDNVDPLAFVSTTLAAGKAEKAIATGMSFLTKVMSTIGLVTYCCYKVTNSNEFELHFKAQLQYILQNLLANKHDKFLIIVTFPVHLRFGEVLEVAYRCGLKPGVSEEGILYVSLSTRVYEHIKL